MPSSSEEVRSSSDYVFGDQTARLGKDLPENLGACSL